MLMQMIASGREHAAVMGHYCNSDAAPATRMQFSHDRRPVSISTYICPACDILVDEATALLWVGVHGIFLTRSVLLVYR